jgi:hypothetical protein
VAAGAVRRRPHQRRPAADQLVTCREFLSEAAFAALAGTSPIPASSGKITRHRLNRGGDRQLNQALHTIALVRLPDDPETRAYATRCGPDVGVAMLTSGVDGRDRRGAPGQGCEVVVPFLSSPVSSTTSTAPSSPRSPTT